MLELAREHLLEMTQSEVFAPIYVRLTDGRVEHDSETGSEDDPGNGPGSGPESGTAGESSSADGHGSGDG
jgi:hypothetical protein